MDDPSQATRTNRERMLAGDLYIADDPELAERMRRGTRLAAEFAELWPRDREAARAILPSCSAALGEETVVRAPIYVDYGDHLTIGARTFVNFGLVALDVAPITIGDDCQIGPNVQLLTASTRPSPSRAAPSSRPPRRSRSATTSGSAAASIVLPGVTIGDDSVIGAGAVVTKDVPAGVLAVGNPARVRRARS